MSGPRPAWAGLRQWRILDAGSGDGRRFLATWQAWRADPQRPRLLHFVALQAGPVAAADFLRCDSALAPLAAELARRAYGLTPGCHRLSFEQGRVLLTLCSGDTPALLRALDFTADAIFLAGPAWDRGALKAIARLCRSGTVLDIGSVAAPPRRDLASCGFQPHEGQTLVYAPAWPVKALRAGTWSGPDRCIVIGAGLAGAAVAASLASRGWQVEVLDEAAAPAAGASALPAGLLAPHQSPDDNVLSRLSRIGIRITLQACESLLGAGDWEASGALEYRGDDVRPLPPVPHLESWTREATAAEKQAAGMPAVQPAWWHQNAAWVRPAALVRAWLAQPGVVFHGGCQVAALEPSEGGWRVLGAGGALLAEAPLVIVAAAHASGALLPGGMATHPVRGQVSWGLQDGAALPPVPLHGQGHMIPRVPTGEGLAWYSGSTYGRGDPDAAPRAADHDANLQRLRELAPAVAQELASRFAGGQVRAWSGVRCASPDRRPLVGELQPGLWVSTAMGSRGLTFAALCGELIAARLHGEPLPLESRLARALDVRRAGTGSLVGWPTGRLG